MNAEGAEEMQERNAEKGKRRVRLGCPLGRPLGWLNLCLPLIF